MLPSVNLPEPFEALAGVVGEGEAVHPLVTSPFPPSLLPPPPADSPVSAPNTPDGAGGGKKAAAPLVAACVLSADSGAAGFRSSPVLSGHESAN